MHRLHLCIFIIECCPMCVLKIDEKLNWIAIQSANMMYQHPRKDETVEKQQQRKKNPHFVWLGNLQE